MRERAQQSWPQLPKTANREDSMQRFRSASANTTFAALPPSSRETRVILSAHRRMMCEPTSVEPVNETFPTWGCLTSASPVTEPGPGSTEITPGGSPASIKILANASTESGVSWAGFTTTVLPQARAGAIFHDAITSGKFQGVMRAHTPTGSRRVTSRPASCTGMVSPKILLAAPPQYSRTAATRPISSRASRMGLPALRASITAISSRRPRTMVEAFSSILPRAVALRRGHCPLSNALQATCTARSTSPGPASATSAKGAPVPGSMTEKVLPSAAETRSPPITSCSVIIKKYSFTKAGRQNALLDILAASLREIKVQDNYRNDAGGVLFISYEAVTATSSTKKAVVACEVDVWPSKTSVTVCPA